MISKIFDFIIKIKDIIWVIIVLIITLSLLSHCESTNRLEKEIDTLTNNTYALSDSIRQYRDELGNTIAEKHALQLTQEEMERTIGELQQKIDWAVKKAGAGDADRFKFVPHVSLARLRGTSIDELFKYIAENNLFHSREFLVDSFSLFASRARENSEGKYYTVEETYPLALI
jgi:2'-5' RNA ligase